MKQSIQFGPHLQVIIAALIWSLSGSVIKYLNFPPTSITFFRAAVPALILLIFFSYQRINIFGKGSKLMFLASFLDAISKLFYFIAFSYTSIVKAIIALYTWPIFVAIFSFIFLKEKLRKIDIFGILLGFAGVVFIYLDNQKYGSADFIGLSAILISAVIFAITVIIYKKESNKYSNIETIFFQNIVGAIIFLPFFLVSRPFPSTNGIMIAIIYGFLIGIVGYMFFFSALKKMKASTASSLAYVEVLGAALIGVFLFHENMTMKIALGGSMIILSAFLIRKEDD